MLTSVYGQGGKEDAAVDYPRALGEEGKEKKRKKSKKDKEGPEARPLVKVKKFT